MNEKLSRREFLQTACISVGALSLSGAGLRAAVAVRKNHPELTVVVAIKMMSSRNATCMAEGGINGVTDLNNGDSYKLHAYDTVKGGAYLVDQDAAMKFCELA